MLKAKRFVVALLMLALPFALISCSTEKDPAIALTKEFLKKATKGDKSLKDIIDFDAAASKYGLSPKELVKTQGEAKWEEIKNDTTNTIISTFSELNGDYKDSFTDFKVDEKGADYWIVSYVNPVKERKAMKVRKVDGKLKGYFFNK